VRNAIPLYDLHMSYSHHILTELSLLYPQVRHAYLPFGFPEGLEVPSGIEAVERVCFIGNGDANRARFMRVLERQGIRVDVFGPQWKQYFKGSSEYIRFFPAVYRQDYWNHLHKYRIQLNLLRPQNQESHNMRTFEVPAIGGVLVTQYTPEQASFFEDRKEVFFYKSEDELFQIIHTALKMQKEEVFHIRQNARSRSLQSHYSYQDRSRQALELFTQLMYA
jgi:spore maturation protein CgeB